MFDADASVWRITVDGDQDGFAPDPAKSLGLPLPVARERLTRYRQLLAELGLTQLRGDEARDHISLVASARGLMIGGSTKGYAYLRHPPATTVAGLDGFEPDDGQRDVTGFRSLGGGWYLYLDVHR